MGRMLEGAIGVCGIRAEGSVGRGYNASGRPPPVLVRFDLAPGQLEFKVFWRRSQQRS
jgi:hypothetical protein